MHEHLLRFDKTKRLVFLDFETYNLNLNFSHNKPWQIGMLRVIGQDIEAEHDILVKWPHPPKFDPAMVFHIFKCSVEQLLNRIDTRGIAPEEAFRIMFDELEKADYIVGHNTLGFDIYLMFEYYKLMGKRADHLVTKFIDTNCLAKGIKMSMPYKPGENFMEYQYKILHKKQKGVKTRLGLLGTEYGIEHDYQNLHDAITDLKLNKKVWEKLRLQVEI